MGPKRNIRARTAPYDTEYVNWTMNRLQDKLRTRRINFRSNTRRMALVRLLLDSEQLTNQNVGRDIQEVVMPTPNNATGTPEVVQGEENPNQEMATMIANLSDSVNRLQDCYSCVE